MKAGVASLEGARAQASTLEGRKIQIPIAASMQMKALMHDDYIDSPVLHSHL